MRSTVTSRVFVKLLNNLASLPNFSAASKTRRASNKRQATKTSEDANNSRAALILNKMNEDSSFQANNLDIV